MGEFIIQQYNQDMTHWWLSENPPAKSGDMSSAPGF